MVRRTMFAVAATALLALAGPAVPASAGGGCHSGATTGEGDTVEMRDACFTPSTIRIAPGDAVTFVNQDPMTHNVGGMGWGELGELQQGDAFTATFADAGIYPYACSYHPGMTGAVVVGDGTGAGNGIAVTVEPFLAASQPADEAAELADAGATVAATDPVATSSPDALGWVAAGAAGLVLGLGLGTFSRSRSKAGSSPS